MDNNMKKGLYGWLVSDNNTTRIITQPNQLPESEPDEFVPVAVQFIVGEGNRITGCEWLEREASTKEPRYQNNKLDLSMIPAEEKSHFQLATANA